MLPLVKREEEFKTWVAKKMQTNKNYEMIFEAMALARLYHTGFRKDGITPEFQHQVDIAIDVAEHCDTLLFAPETLSVVFLHDLVEDYGIGTKVWDLNLSRLSNLEPVPLSLINQKFGVIVSESVDKISKICDGVKKGKKKYFRDIATCPITSVAKLGDRKHNLNSMLNVFSLEKQERYASEVEKEFMPLISKVECLFPQQIETYDKYKNEFKQITGFVMERVESFSQMGLDLTKTPQEALCVVHEIIEHMPCSGLTLKV